MTTSVLALVGEMNGCTLWRILQPYAELQRRGYPADWIPRNDIRLPDYGPLYDAIIFPRLHWPVDKEKEANNFVRALNNAGKAVIYEIDDDMFSEEFVNRQIWLHGMTREEGENVRDSIVRTIKRVDGVTVSSQRMATMVRQITDKPVKVVPNAIDLRWFQDVQEQAERKVKGLTIGWAGGKRSDRDSEQMAIAWGRIAEKFPNVTFVVQGHQPQVIYDHVPDERIVTLEWMPIEAYPMGMVNIDIGCCPLADSPFNRAKTYIKAMEYAAGGAAVVASPTLYSRLIDDGYDGYIARSADDWERALGSLVSSANIRNRMAQRLLYKVERDHSLQETVLRWPVAWTEIVEDFRDRNKYRIAVPDYGIQRARVYA